MNGTTQVIAFTYDTVGRLSTVARNGVTTASYTYDLNGNRATKVTAGGTETAVVDDQDRLVSYGGATYAYTDNGELTRKVVGTDTTHYTYDALGNLTQVVLPDGTEIGYLIDAQNRRIGKTVNDTLVRAWLYQGQLTPVAELDGSGNVVSRFVYATGVNVPDYMVRGDSTYRLIRDHLGSVRVVVNVASGSIAQRLAYDEFGIEVENTNPGWQPFGYAGGLVDAQTGLIRFGARDYDPVIGRWTAKDPTAFAGGVTSLYAYAANDPVSFVDINGQKFHPVVVLAGAAIGAVASASVNAFVQWRQHGEVNLRPLGFAALNGFLYGGFSTAMVSSGLYNPLQAAALSGALSSGITSWLERLLYGPCDSAADANANLVLDMAVGSVAGLLGGGSNQSIRALLSPELARRYANEVVRAELRSLIPSSYVEFGRSFGAQLWSMSVGR